MSKRISIFLVLFLAGVTMAAAQGVPPEGQPAPEPAMRPEFGVRLGGVASQLRGDDVGIVDDGTDARLGWMASVYAAVPLARGFYVQPEVGYTQKGGELSFGQEVAGVTQSTVIRFETNYIQVPVTLAYRWQTGSPVEPVFYAGPYVSFATNRKAKLDFDDGEDPTETDDNVLKDFDYGAVFGADLGFKVLQRSMATVGLRYDLGIYDIAKNEKVVGGIPIEETARNGDWTVLLGVRF